MSEYTLENIAQVVEILREKSPLTHCITNVVTVKDWQMLQKKQKKLLVFLIHL